MKRHATDTVSLVFGLIFAALVGWWAVDTATGFDLDGGWLLVIALVLVALITLVSTVAKRKPATPQPAVEPGAAQPEPAEPDADSPTEILRDETGVIDDDQRDTEDLTAAVRHQDDPTAGPRP